MSNVVALFHKDTVTTAIGELPRDALSYTDVVNEDDKAIYVTRKWFHAGEVVRQDAWVDMKSGLSSEVQKGH